MATADSRVSRSICTNSMKGRESRLMFGPWFPKRVIKRWPAIIFAAKRTDRVNGRIIFLIVSIHTINIINIEGVPWGTMWANMWTVCVHQL